MTVNSKENVYLMQLSHNREPTFDMKHYGLNWSSSFICGIFCITLKGITRIYFTCKLFIYKYKFICKYTLDSQTFFVY